MLDRTVDPPDTNGEGPAIHPPDRTEDGGDKPDGDKAAIDSPQSRKPNGSYDRTLPTQNPMTPKRPRRLSLGAAHHPNDKPKPLPKAAAISMKGQQDWAHKRPCRAHHKRPNKKTIPPVIPPTQAQDLKRSPSGPPVGNRSGDGAKAKRRMHSAPKAPLNSRPVDQAHDGPPNRDQTSFERKAKISRPGVDQLQPIDKPGKSHRTPDQSPNLKQLLCMDTCADKPTQDASTHTRSGETEQAG